MECEDDVEYEVVQEVIPEIVDQTVAELPEYDEGEEMEDEEVSKAETDAAQEEEVKVEDAMAEEEEQEEGAVKNDADGRKKLAELRIAMCAKRAALRPLRPRSDFRVKESGIDIEAEDEKERQKARRERFGNDAFEPLPESRKQSVKIEVDEDRSIEKLAARSKRFNDASSLMTAVANLDENCAELRVDPVATDSIRSEVVHLWGVDRFLTVTVLKTTHDYGKSHVEWIDDSSCNVVFDSEETAKLYLNEQAMKLTIPVAPTEPVYRGKSSARKPEEASMIEGVWYISKPLVDNEKSLSQLLMRQATMGDVKLTLGTGSTKKKFSYYNKFLEVNRNRDSYNRTSHERAPHKGGFQRDNRGQGRREVRRDRRDNSRDRNERRNERDSRRNFNWGKKHGEEVKGRGRTKYTPMKEEKVEDLLEN